MSGRTGLVHRRPWAHEDISALSCDSLGTEEVRCAVESKRHTRLRTAAISCRDYPSPSGRSGERSDLAPRTPLAA